LPNASTRAKARWNAANYVQIKVSVNPKIAVAFKAACVAAGVSMAGELSRFMAGYAAVAATNQAAGIKTECTDSVSTMKKRRKTVRAVTGLLEQVRDAEERFIDNAPENLQSAPIYENAEQYVSVLDDVIEQLGEIY
jgi:hypothetical protein